MDTNLAAIELVATLRDRDREPTAAERALLASWSGWGAVPQLFDERRPGWGPRRDRLLELLGEDGFASARRTTINAHYTHPLIAAEIWTLISHLGFEQGRVLEPGCGAGVFIAAAPPGAHMTGIELDDMTATIAEMLHPEATIICRSFGAADRTPDGSYDLVVGNVPFADVRLHDPRHNPHGHSLHDHFIVKSLHLTRPGGLVAVLTSRYTLDSANPAARREMAGLADLLGAVRLPAGAHRRAAGTEAVTDLLVLRRREADRQPAHEGWVNTEMVEVDGVKQRVSRYLAEHPERVLGRLATDPHGMYRSRELTVIGDGHPEAVAAALRAQAQQITSASLAAGLGMLASTSPVARPEFHQIQAVPQELWEGHLAANPDGSFTQARAGLQRPFDPARGTAAELRLLLGLRDAARLVLELEAESTEDTPRLDSQRAVLRDRYETYLARYGPINRYRLRRTGRQDPDTGAERMARVTPGAIRTLAEDPFCALVMSLETFEDSTQTAVPASILNQRVIVARRPPRGADSPQDALAVSLDAGGRVDLSRIAQLLGVSVEQARSQLGELVYENPADGALLPAAEYLSGNVRLKLEEARAAAQGRPELSVNVTALERAQPEDLGPAEIEARLGAAWIDADTHRQFLAEVLDDPTIVVEHPGGLVWGVRGDNRSVKAVSEWGTGRMPAAQLARTLLEQRPVRVTDELDDGRRVLNVVETTAAEDKARALQARFAEWVWEDPERTTRLAGEYNRQLNALALRSYDEDGRRLSLPGLAQTFTPREHQRTAVARMIAEPAVGLFHEVGAGKTAEMAIGAMELRRLGMVSKPCAVVPNHMLEQFSREWLQLYPQARLLTASTADIEGGKRRRFVSRAATSDWDAIVMSRSAFERIPMSAANIEAYERRQLEQLRAVLEAARDGKGLTVKRLEKAVMRQQERLKSLLESRKDAGVTFEETGIDYLLVDEAHGYKNLHTASAIPDAAIEGSKRASDLHLKLEWLRSRHGARIATLATATPIANSVTEAHVMTRYLRPDVLADAGVLEFDRWAATFGKTISEIEMAPTGGGDYRMKTRFAAFQNVPEMLRIFHVFADVKTGEDLELPRPQLKLRADGHRGPETVVVPASERVRAYINDLGARAEAVRARTVDPTEDNMLKISGDGRKAALDMRMIDRQAAPVPGACKLEVAAERIASIHRQHAGQLYDEPSSGQRSMLPGALQIVFCDLGTPGGDMDRFDVYAELRARLGALGVPDGMVRFVHEARNDKEKARLFAACRAGEVSVIVGSTEKMGVGTNIQPRAVALHHLDCPWRPADIEQRDGRLLRQGNQNGEVSIYRYVVEQSFDAYSWQTVERKAKFIDQVMKGRLEGRTAGDVGDNALSFAEVKALASGDPLLLEHAQATNELARLSSLHRTWERGRQTIRERMIAAQARAEARQPAIERVRQAATRTVDVSGDRFVMTVMDHQVDERRGAGELLFDCVTRLARGEQRPIGELGGHRLSARLRRDRSDTDPELEVWLDAIPGQEPAHATVEQAREMPLSLIRQLEHRVNDLPALCERLSDQRDQAIAEHQQARAALDLPFKHHDELQAAKQTVERVNQQMRDAEKRREHEHAATHAPSSGPTPSEGERLGALDHVSALEAGARSNEGISR